MSGAAARRPPLLPALLLAAVLAGACGLPAPAAGGPAVRPLPSRPLEPARIAPFPGPLDLARDGSALWVTPAGDVYVQEGSGARAAPRFVARGWRAAFWYRGGLGIVGLRSRGESFQVVYRLPGGGQETLGTTDAPAQVQVTAGGWVAWPLAGDLEMADPVTESRSRRPGLLRGAERFRLAPDGRQVALARAGRLERVTLTPAGRGSGPEAETLGPLAGAAAFAWSADGRWLAWAAPAGGGEGGFDLRLYDARRHRQRPLWRPPAGAAGAGGAAAVAALHWLPGRPLLLVETGGGSAAGGRLYWLVDLAGRARRLPFGGGEAWPLPDGSGFLFAGPPRGPAGRAEGQPGVWAVRLGGSG